MNPLDLNVFVVDDDASLRRSLGALLVARGYGVKTFASGEDFLASAKLQEGGCVLLDHQMYPGMTGLAVFDALRALGSPVVVVFLSSHGTIPNTVLAVKDGAFDWLEKPCSESRLLEVVQAALAEAGRVASRQAAKRTGRKRWDELTSRQMDVARHVRTGRPNKVIAKILGIDVRTVEAHRASSYDKLNVSNATELDGFMRSVDL